MKTLKYLLCGITMCALACSSSKDDGDGPGKASNTLKVMSFNVRYNSANDEGDTNWDVRKAAVVKMINTVQPDVVGLQEPRTAQRTYLKTNLPNYAYMEVPGTGDGKGGNTCLIYRQDRFTLVNNGYFFLSPTPDEPSRCWDVGDTQWRTSVWVHLKEKETGKEFWFLSTTGRCAAVRPRLICPRSRPMWKLRRVRIRPKRRLPQPIPLSRRKSPHRPRWVKLRLPIRLRKSRSSP